MSVSETQRLEMYLELRKVLGDDVADTLIEHLPPSGWGDVARVKDLDHVEQVLGTRITHVEQRLKGLTGTLWVLIGSMVTISSALLVMMIQLNASIGRL